MRYILVVVGLFTHAALAGDFKYGSNTVGAAIENRLANVVKSCYNDKISYRQDRFIPTIFDDAALAATLTSAVDKSRTVDVSLETLSLQVFEKEPTVGDIANIATPALKFPGSFPEYEPSRSADRVIYSFNCTSALNLALDQNFSFSPNLGGGPAAAIKSAFNAQVSGATNTNLLVMYGQFESPLSYILNSSDSHQRIHGHSAVWDYYFVNKKATGKYVRTFRGWMTALSSLEEASQALGGKGEGSISLLMFKASVAGNVDLHVGRKNSASLFSVIFNPYSDNNASPALITATLPIPSEIGKVLLSETTFRPILSGPLPVFKNSPLIVGADVRELPTQFCEKGNWTVLSDGGNATAGSTVAVSKVDNQGRYCEIRGTLTPTTSGLTRLGITFREQQHPITGNSKTEYIQLSTSITVADGVEPGFFFVGTPKIHKLSPDLYSLTAKSSYTAEGKVNRIRKADGGLADPIDCGGGPKPLMRGSEDLAIHEQTKTIDLAVNFDANGADLTKCKYTFPVAFDFDDQTGTHSRVQLVRGDLVLE